MPINYAKLLRAVQTNAYKCHLMLTGHLINLELYKKFVQEVLKVNFDALFKVLQTLAATIFTVPSITMIEFR